MSESLMQHKARLKCPVCELTYGVAGLGAIGVSNGDERPCSWECEEQHTGRKVNDD